MYAQNPNRGDALRIPEHYSGNAFRSVIPPPPVPTEESPRFRGTQSPQAGELTQAEEDRGAEQAGEPRHEDGVTIVPQNLAERDSVEQDSTEPSIPAVALPTAAKASLLGNLLPTGLSLPKGLSVPNSIGQEELLLLGMLFLLFWGGGSGWDDLLLCLVLLFFCG